MEGLRRENLRTEGGIRKVNVLRLGIPKGSLENATIELFKKSGWKINKIQSYRQGDYSVVDVIKNFDYKSKNLLFRLVKSLMLGQLLLGKDQWTVIGSKL
jgi:ATP phosphoribosyltransferase